MDLIPKFLMANGTVIIVCVCAYMRVCGTIQWYDIFIPPLQVNLSSY